MARTLTEAVRVKVDPATRLALEARAKETDRSVSAVIRRAIREHLNPKGTP